MSLTTRLFLLDEHDQLFRLASKKLLAMLNAPENHKLPRFAGCGVRMADLIIELVERKPKWLRQSDFRVLSFDTAGRLDVQRFGSQQMAHTDIMLGEVLDPTEFTGSINAANRFLARGGQWAPNHAQ
jgi:hypothetical protein